MVRVKIVNSKGKTVLRLSNCTPDEALVVLTRTIVEVIGDAIVPEHQEKVARAVSSEICGDVAEKLSDTGKNEGARPIH
jgi:hypothetical protein